MNWRIVAALTTALALCVAATFAITMHFANRAHTGDAPLYPEAIPLDFADERVRAALDAYGMTLHDGLEPIASDCSVGSREIYRVEVIGGLSAIDDAFRIVDITVGGDRAVVDEKRLHVGTGAEPDRAEWRIVSTKRVGPAEIDALRERAGHLLLSGVPAALNDRNVDSSEWTIQMCRRGRYHFFQRHSPEAAAADNTAFLAFARGALALRVSPDPKR